MKKAIVIALAVILLAGGAFIAAQLTGVLGAVGSPQVIEAAESETSLPESADTIIVDARVIPSQRAELSLPSSGIVAEILVNEDEQVEAGQTLLRLESAREQASVAQAEAQLARAQAQLAELKAGARSQELASATAALEAAQARLDRIVDGPLAEDIEAAEASLAEARANLQDVLDGASREQIISAETELADAQATLRQAQNAYDRVAGNPDIGARPEAAQLEQATNSVTAAQARLDDLKRGATASEIAAARARVRQAQAQLDSLQATNPADIAAAEAEVRQAQAQYDLLAAGTRDESIVVAEADVESAAAALDQALAVLADTELRAPFAGIVASLDLSVGEQVNAGTPIIQLADFSHWEIETEDLTEFDAVQLREGMEATVTYDAIPDLEQQGVVRLIRPIGEDKRGDIVYTVVIELTENDERLLWNLTAVVSIDPS